MDAGRICTGSDNRLDHLRNAVLTEIDRNGKYEEL